MIKLIIIIGRKYFSNYVAQGNYCIIHPNLLTVLLIDLSSTIVRF